MRDEKTLLKRYGSLRAQLLIRRIQTIRMSQSFEQLKSFPGHFHELTGDRSGQWACNLDQPYRLIFEDAGNGTVNIIEIVNYHGK
ncbi:MAG: type II toxin-antitoxin system RelE/ParE family toxin [Bacteroidales bacterium]|nr:type II toxin-antitoxin system RelE/ParE family toxin [Bacteroidales bacterium]